jgi:hypothetical protein
MTQRYPEVRGSQVFQYYPADGGSRVSQHCPEVGGSPEYQLYWDDQPYWAKSSAPGRHLSRQIGQWSQASSLRAAKVAFGPASIDLLPGALANLLLLCVDTLISLRNHNASRTRPH